MATGSAVIEAVGAEALEEEDVSVGPRLLGSMPLSFFLQPVRVAPARARMRRVRKAVRKAFEFSEFK
jgi:hypothetical protein